MDDEQQPDEDGRPDPAEIERLAAEALEMQAAIEAPDPDVATNRGSVRLVDGFTPPQQN